MLRVNGLYGHVQQNNRKAAILMVAFLGLFVAMQSTVLLIPKLFFDDIETALQTAAGEISAGNGIFKVEAGRIENAVLRPIAEPAPPAGFTNLLPGASEPPVATENPSQPNNLAAAPGPGNHTADQPLFFRILLDWRLLLAVLVVLGMVHIAVATWWNSLFIRYAMRAKPLARKEFPALYDMVENLALTAGMPCPAIEVIDSPSLNAYASGLDPKHARVGLTTGIINKLDRAELEAVVAHELTHIRTGDSRLMAVTKACVDLVVPFGGNVVEKIRARPILPIISVIYLFSIQPTNLFFLMVALVVGITIAAFVVKALVLHTREFVADAGAVELTQNPAALISALRKIAGNDAVHVVNPTAQAMMFSGSAVGWLSTHPAVEDRIAAIRTIALVKDGEVESLRARSRGSVDRGPGAPVSGFGQRRDAATEIPAGASFAIASAAAPAWQEEAVFKPADQFKAGHDGQQWASGDSPNLFEKYVVTGRAQRWIDQTKKILMAPLRLWFGIQVAILLLFILPIWILMMFINS